MVTTAVATPAAAAIAAIVIVEQHFDGDLQRIDLEDRLPVVLADRNCAAAGGNGRNTEDSH